MTTRKSALQLTVALLLLGTGILLWMAHARAWDLGGRSPVLSFDAAQYAVAARTLAEHGRLGTTFALPVELAAHPSPPWPLAVVQPGLVLVEAAIERVAPPALGPRQRPWLALDSPARREWLTLVAPFLCYLALALLLARIAARVLEVHAPHVRARERALAALAVGGVFLLDPEAQHFAVGGFTELPYTLGLVAALALLASGGAARAPLLFGLVLGVTGAFRGNLIFVAPLMAAAAAALTPPGRRYRTLLRVVIGFALPLAPWWIYKWRAFGSPGWDLSALGLWDGVAGWNWFSLTHLPAMPEVPRGSEAARLLAGKLGANAGALLLSLTVGTRALWIGCLGLWIAVGRGARALRVAGAVILGHAAIALLVAALGAAWLRYLFPARVPLEAAGMLAAWGLLARLPEGTIGPAGMQASRALVAVIGLGWGAWQTSRGNAEAAATATMRGLPSVATLGELGRRMDEVLGPDEPVMSNLGPTLAWYARRPVVHLALTPADVEACRARLPLRHVVLAFRGPEQAWKGWDEVMREPGAAPSHPEWNVRAVRTRRMPDGFLVVWLELAPSRELRASNAGASRYAALRDLGLSRPSRYSASSGTRWGGSTDRR